MILTYIVFFLGLAALLSGALAALGYLRESFEGWTLRLAWRVTLLGTGLILLTFLLRIAQIGHLPFANAADSLNLFIFFASATALTVARSDPLRPLLVFYLPPMGCVALVAAYKVLTAWGGAPPKDLANIPLMLHVGMVFLAYALFFIASLSSAAYVYQSRQLKLRRTTGFFRRLPSLEQLDTTLFRMVRLGYPIFVLTMLLGLAWSFEQRQLLTAAWWLSPKVFLSFMILGVYAVSFHGRSLGILRGPKLAYFVCVGFGSLLLVSLLLRVLQLSSWHFYEV